MREMEIDDWLYGTSHINLESSSKNPESAVEQEQNHIKGN
jgi:hypothetical protein